MDRRTGISVIDSLKIDDGFDVINALNLDITHCAHVFLDEQWKHDDVCDPFSRLYFVRNGSGYLKTEGKIIPLIGDYVYLVPSGCTFSYGCTSLEKLFYHVTVTTAEKYDLLSELKAVCRLPYSETDFQALLHYSMSDNYLDLFKMKTMLCKTIVDFTEAYLPQKIPVKQYSELVEKTITFIQQNTRINLSVADISKHLFVSESKIRKTFQKETGITIGKYIDDLVFFEARQLLAKKHISIGEISQSLGFCDQFYFSRRFKEKYKQSPSEFRKEIMMA